MNFGLRIADFAVAKLRLFNPTSETRNATSETRNPKLETPKFEIRIPKSETLMICPSCGHENIEGTDRCENCLASFRDLDVPRADTAAGLARSVMEDDLRQLDQEETLFVTPDTPAIEVVRRMKAAHTGCALVIDTRANRLKGIFTEHDVLTKMTGARSGSDHVEVKDLMSPNPETLRETDSIAAALNKMSLGRYRHIPVVKNDGGYSVASIKSVLKYIAREDW